MKKSWHPVLMSNQRRVWEEEKKALDERKRIDQMMKERQEERQIQELQDMQEAAGGTKRLNRVDWMYSGPAAGQAGTTEEMEGYLLGKRRVDRLIKGTENQKLEKGASSDSFMAIQNANTVRDTASKIREDPLLAIKKQEQAAYDALMNDPVRQRLLLKATGYDVKSKYKDGKNRKSRHREDRDDHHHTHKSSGNSRSRHHEKGDGYRHSHHSHRRSRSPHRDVYDHYHQQHHHIHKSYRRSESPYREEHDRHYYNQAPHRRSLSSEEKQGTHQSLKHSSSWQGQKQRISSSPDYSAPENSVSSDRALKLAQMQRDAYDLDQDRERRITAIEAREKIEREADEAARSKSAIYGGKGDFVNGLNRKAGALDISERMRRGRGGLEKGFND